MHASWGLTAHNPIPEKQKKELLKLADTIEVAPYSMHSAATHLRHWLHGTLKPSPMLDCGFILSATSPQMQSAQEACPLTANNQAQSLEPRVQAIVLSSKRSAKQPKEAHTNVSLMAKYVYPAACEAMREHACSWAEAMRIAERAWKHVPDEAADAVAATLDMASDSDAEGDVAEVPFVWERFARTAQVHNLVFPHSYVAPWADACNPATQSGQIWRCTAHDKGHQTAMYPKVITAVGKTQAIAFELPSFVHLL